MLPKSNNLNTGFTGFLKAKSFVKKFISSSLMVLFISYMIVLLALGGCSSVDSVTEGEQKYTVTFDTGGGSSIEEVKVSSGDTLTKPSPDPVSNNYSFVGWYSDVELTEEYDFSKAVTSSFTLYAKWKEIHTIIFNTGEGSSISSMKVTNGDTLTKPTDPTRSDYSFMGWYSDEEPTEEYDFSEVVTNSFTLYAKWDKIHTVTFDIGEGDSISSVKVTNGDTLTKPSPDPVSNNYSFVGWYSDVELTEEYDFSKAVTNSFTLYAKWKEIHTVTFDIGEVSSISSVKVTNGDTLTKPTAPTKIDYSFMGWYSDEELAEEYDFSKVVTNSFTLYAKWTKIMYTVTFDTGGGSSIAEVIIGSGDTLTQPSSDPVSNNYFFTGWYSDVGLTQEYDFSEAVTSSFTLYAKWVESHTVTFDTGGGSSIAAVKVGSGDILTEPSSDPTSNNYSFVGWFSDEELTEEYDFIEVVTNSFTLYAKWTKIMYTITFDTKGGSSIEEVKVDSGDILTEPSPDPTRENYSFVGWYSDAGLTQEYDFSNAVTSSFTLYAKWEKIIYTVTFNTFGGTLEGERVVEKKAGSGDVVAKPSSDPIKSGYSFAGWIYSSGGSGGLYDFSKAVINSFTLYANWDKIHTVTFDVGGGSSISSMKVTNGDTLTKPSSDPTSNNYFFGGWHSDTGLTQLYDFSKEVTSDFTLYAKWSTTEYTITFDTRGGSSIANVSVGEGDALIKPSPDPTKSGYLFAGWYKDELAVEKFDFSQAILTNMTVYAAWSKSMLDLSNIAHVGRIPSDRTTLTPQAQYAISQFSGTPTANFRYIIQGGSGDGSSWDNAAGSISGILTGISRKSSAKSADNVYFVLVASGTYTANKIRMQNHVAIIGGWDPAGGWNRSGRTILDGESRYQVFKNEANLSLNNTAVLYEVTIANGIAEEGGGMYNDQASPSLMNVIFFGNRASVYGGGGLYSLDSSPFLSNVTFSENVAYNADGSGGGMYNRRRSSSSSVGFVKPVLIDVTFSKNTANDSGGGMYNDQASPTLMNVIFFKNEASSLLFGGGGLFNQNGSPFLSNVIFSGNKAVNRDGGGMYNKKFLFDSPVIPILVNVTFSENTSKSSAGGMYNEDSSPSLKNIVFSGNKATDGNGGGMYNKINASPNLVNVTFSDNVSGNSGGGIYNDSASPYLKNVTFENNKAYNGGGMYAKYSFPILVNTTFSGNQATGASGKGGGIYNSIISSVKLVNVTLYNNTAKNSGGGIYSEAYSAWTGARGPLLVNTVLWGNKTNNGSNQIQIGNNLNEKLDLHYSLIEGGDDLGKGVILDVPTDPGKLNYPHSHNIMGDPLLGSLSDNGGDVLTHALEQNSPAIDAGIYAKKSGGALYFSVDQTSWYTSFNENGLSGTATLTADLPSNTEDINATDARGDLRTTKPDIGAYEKR